MDLTPEEMQAVQRIRAGAFLRELREKANNGKGYSLGDLEKICKVSKGFLSGVESGSKTPSDVLLRQLANLYEVDENSLFEKFGRSPLFAREAIEKYAILQKFLSDIESSKRSDEDKQQIIEELYNYYKKNIDISP